MRTLICSLSLWTLLAASAVFAQPTNPPDTLWTRAFGTTQSETALGVCQAADGGLCIVGERGSGPEMYVVRTTGSGDTLWTRALIRAGGPNRGYAVRATPDNGFVIGGVTPINGSSGDFLVLKLDANGDTLWSRILGGAGSDRCSALLANADGTFLAAGFLTNSSGLMQGFVAKFAANGDTLWTHSYGGTAAGRLNSISTAGAGFILCGTIGAAGSQENLWMLRIADDGAQVWSRNYGGGQGEEGGGAKMTPDGGFVAAGYTQSYGAGLEDYYLVRTTAQGDTLWTRVYGTPSLDRCVSVQLASDGGFVLAGFSQGQNNGGSNNDFLWVKYSALGVHLWDKISGGPYNDFCFAAEKTRDGGYVAVGRTNSYGHGDYDFYAVRLAGVSGVGGFIRDDITNAPLENAIVQELGNSLQAISDDQGHYILSSFPGVHDFIVYGQCVERDTIRNFEVLTDSIMSLDIVVGQPEANVPQTSINILAPNHGTASENLYIYNDGSGLMDWRLATTTIEPRGAWLTATPSSGSISSGDSAVVQVRVALDTTNIGVFDLFGAIDVHMNSCPDSIVHVSVYASIVNAEDDVPAQLPTEYSLRAYPNPFNPASQLEFAITASGPVRLQVLDIQGRLVSTLVDNEQSAGVHSVAFDGSALASGIYFARLEAGSRVVTTKLLLLK